MLSSLSKGYGHWDNGQVDLYQKDYKVESSVLPAVEGTETHRHGITVSGRNTAMSTVGAKTPGSRTKDLSIEGKLNLPKTFSTRKGALQLFTAPEDLVTEEKDQNKYAQAQRPRYVQVQRMGGKDLIDLSLKLGTLERLSKSVLQFGDQDDFDKDKTSISDEKNKLFLKFLHSIDNEQDADTHLRPGGDLSVYLRDLKTRASSRFYSKGTMYVPKSRESQELQAILRGLDSNWPLSFPQDNFSDRRSAISEQFTRPVSRVSSRGPSPGPPSTPRSTYQVLSTKKLAASIKSSNYLGRPSSTLSMFEDETLTDFDRCGTSSPQPVTHASVNKKKWSPTDSTGGSLASGSLAGSELDSDDERKRTRHRDYSSGLLFQGRNKYKVKGQSGVQVTGKGEGRVQGDRVNSLLAQPRKQTETVYHEVESINEETEEDIPDAWKRHSQEHLASVEEERKVQIRASPTGSGRTSRVSSSGSTDTRTPTGRPVSVIRLQDSRAPVVRPPEPARHVLSPQSSAVHISETVSEYSGHITSDPSETIEVTDTVYDNTNDQRQTTFEEELTEDVIEQKSPVQEQMDLVAEELSVRSESREEVIEEPAVEEEVYKTIEEPETVEFEDGPETEEVVAVDAEDELEVVRTAQSPPVIEESEEKQEEEVIFDAMETVTTESLDPPMLDGFSTDNDSIVEEDIPEEKPPVVVETTIEEEETMAVSEDEELSPLTDNDVVVEDSVDRLSDKVEEIEETVKSPSPVVVVDVESDHGDGAAPEVVHEERESTPVVIETVVDKVDEDFEDDASSKRKGSRITDDDSERKSLVVVKGTVQTSVDGKPGDDDQTSQTPTPTEHADAQTGAPNVQKELPEPPSVQTEDSDTQKQIPITDQSDSVNQLKPVKQLADSNKMSSDSKLSRPVSGEKRRESMSKQSEPAVSKSVTKEVTDTPMAATVTVDTKTSPEIEKYLPTVDTVQTESKTTALSESKVVTLTEVSKPTSQPELTPVQTPEEPTTTPTTSAIANTGRQAIKKKQQPSSAIRRAGGKAQVKTEQREMEPTEKSEDDTTKTDQVVKEETAKPIDDKTDLKVTEQERKPPEEVVEDIPMPVSLTTTAPPATVQEGGDVLGDLAALNLLPRDPKTSTKGKKKGADKKSKSGSIKSGLSSDGDKPGSPDYKLVLASDRLQAKEEKLVIPDHLTDALGRRPSKSYEALEKDLERMTDIVDSTLSGPTLQAVGEGLSTEEFELAKKILQSRLAEAQEKLDDPGTQKKKKGAKTSAKGKGKKGKKKGEGEDNDVDREQEDIRKKQQEEQQRRDAEAKELQRKIAERRALLKNQENLANEKSREIREEMERLEREADAMAMAEEDAKQALADVRKKQREEREVRRKADLERKKQQAVDRREQEKKQLEESRKKEMEMLETIADAEMRRRLREEEERKMYEEDRLAQERLEDELMLAAQDAEDEEERRQEAERQAEEEALDRFRIQQEEADRQTRKLRDERERMEEEEMQRRDYMLMEQRKLEEERTRQREQEDARRELERQHLVELRRLEDEARQKMMEELDKRRNEALMRRDVNLENRNHVDKMKHYQGITRPWTFSYFVRWARDSYERPMGGALDKKKRLRPRPAPPKPAEVPVETLEANPDTNTAT